jgi:hypothetical protein
MGIEKLIEDRWNDKMEDLVAFKSEYGHCKTANTNDHDLDIWVHKQREYYKLYENQQIGPGPLTPSRYERLKSVGLIAAPSKWEQRFEELKQYTLKYGNADVPIDYPKLGIWCLNQRFNLENMPQDRIDMLDSLNFTWNYNTRSLNDEAWNAKYEALLAYIREHGHPNPPKSNDPLSCWVRKQRYEYSKFIKKQKSQINRERISKLDAIGFSFRLRADTIPWEQHFEDLVQFKQEHGHFNIPRSHPTLGNWSAYQKSQFRCFLDGRPSTIDQARADKLVSVGFVEISSSGSAQIPMLSGEQEEAEYDFGFGFNQD